MTDILDSDILVTVGCDAMHHDQRGGQHVAKPCTGVRLDHGPTGTSVTVSSERSQHANKVEALKQLRAAILGAALTRTHRHPLTQVHAYAWRCETCGWSSSIGYDPNGPEAREQRRHEAMLVVVEAAKAYVNNGDGYQLYTALAEAVDALDALEAL